MLETINKILDFIYPFKHRFVWQLKDDKYKFSNKWIINPDYKK